MSRWRPSVPALRPRARGEAGHGGRPRARVLVDADVPEALAVCAGDPVASTLAAARLAVAQHAGLHAAGGQAWGFPAAGPLEAVCWAGANLVPVVPASLDASRARAAVTAFAELARHAGRRSSSVVGERDAVLALWELLAPHWPSPREIRANQPSLAIDREPDVAPDPGVRRSVPAEVPVVLPACVRMFTEEVGYSPVEGGGRAYEERVRSLVLAGRSFVRLAGGDGAPHVVFKAELGAVTPLVAQVQGVWVDPRYRGQGLAAPGMAAVVHLARQGAPAEAARRAGPPVVSLYVNDYNTRALATYRRVGFEQVGTYATVLF
ncbi:GCN5 family acetyltransferase [Cellulosimicrobium funkei]|uniref:GCN5 family acetyltransferase n=1 Tax=Cellulosimicrobium funkei TaxID=264251 RepID=A0A0H2KN96_9MICO|nr:GCN5 family acetyltransferase [Cellulosimicrobium funkei]